MPAAVRDYMSAILKAVEFVSEPNPNRDGISRSPRAAVPALASGLGRVPSPRKEAVDDSPNKSPRRLSRPGTPGRPRRRRAAPPPAPTFAQVETPKQEENRQLIVTQSAPSTDSPKPEAGSIGSAEGSLTVTSDVVVTDGTPVVVTQRSADDRTGHILEVRGQEVRIVHAGP